MSKVVMLSGGVTSFESLLRTLEKTRDVIALFADVRGKNDVGYVSGEDRDTYRFLDDVERLVWPVTRISDGRNIWELFRDRRFIGNTRVDVCSQVLKRQLCLQWMRANAPAAVVVLGFDWTEPHRINGAPGKKGSRQRWKEDGFHTEYPLSEERPYLLKAEYVSHVRQIGIEPPRLYALGFEHNNCGGACVKGGQGQWALLLRVDPDRYMWNEQEEEETRQLIGSDVSILRDRRGGVTKPLTLKEFRLRIQAGERPQDDLFSCSCMG